MSEQPPHPCPCSVELLDARLEALRAIMDERDHRYKERFDAQEKASAVFNKALDSWKSNANEWRGAMEDRERKFLTKGMGAVIGALTLAVLLIQLFRLANATVVSP